jgi:hypothetical protein
VVVSFNAVVFLEETLLGISLYSSSEVPRPLRDREAPWLSPEASTGLPRHKAHPVESSGTPCDQGLGVCGFNAVVFLEETLLGISLYSCLRLASGRLLSGP